VSLFEEPDAGKLHVRFCEGPGPTDVWLKYGGTAGKPGGKRRKQTSTCSIGRNRSTRLIYHIFPKIFDGGWGRRVETEDELERTFAKAESEPKVLSLIEVVLDRWDFTDVMKAMFT